MVLCYPWKLWPGDWSSTTKNYLEWKDMIEEHKPIFPANIKIEVNYKNSTTSKEEQVCKFVNMDIPNLNSFAQISGSGKISRQRKFMSVDDT